MSLCVVLMVPVAIFAAVVAMAAPQRMRAEASMDETAADLAKLAVAMRHGEQAAQGPLEGFPPECAGADPYTAGRCEALYAALAADLGSQGVDLGSLRGYYSDAITTSAAGDVPCGIGNWIDDGTGTRKYAYRSVVLEATHVAVVADWHDAGWAAAQVWPRGLRMGAESVGRLTVAVDPLDSAGLPPCEDQLDVSDRGGKSLRLSDGPPERVGQARPLLHSVRSRSPFGG